MSDQKLWTIEIRGPGSLTLQVPGNPPLYHEGGISVAHLILRQEEVGELKIFAFSAACTLKAWPVDGQDEEQTAERSRFVGLGEEDRVWPSIVCPACPWFDPLQEGSPCGLDTLPSESTEVLRKLEYYAKAEADCPVRSRAKGGVGGAER